MLMFYRTVSCCDSKAFSLNAYLVVGRVGGGTAVGRVGAIISLSRWGRERSSEKRGGDDDLHVDCWLVGWLVVEIVV